ncbi:ACP phosphodiesterase [Luteolibacter flavescens]|uniref:ACP phosphodiesterase n=1 Tax=Luteolibacter flavescens TaxID=1859460 RepID=A0ABT3FSV3_9BACT|nr:ACP phosphodiesterase [Luteolibacter flavescens]MCW1886655.1 ACP phosphodiesterase [Luteolibacter flavescens]
MALNYLAHLLLAENDPLSRIGNLLGDFVPGRPESLTEKFPLKVVQGIVRHRAIDRFSDEHPATTELKSLVAPERRRFAGVIVDLVHDHFLTRHWDEHGPQPLRDFIDRCNGELLAHRDVLPPDLADTLDERIADDWLGHQGTDDGLDGVFHRVSLRHPGFRPIRGAIDDLRRHRAAFEAGFRAFFPLLRTWVRDQGPEANVVMDRR